MFALLLAFTYTLHARDVFQPPKAAAPETWSAATSGREPELFTTREGTQLRGWLYRSDRNDAPYVLFFYGSNEDMAHEAPRLAWLRDAFHVNAVCFDYPGYGFSGGSVDSAAIRSAAVQEFDFTRRLAANPATPIFSYGWSIGTAAAIHVAALRDVAGVILQAPPATSQGMTKWSSKRDVPWYARGFVKLAADADVESVFDNAAAIRTVAAPLLVIQGELDDVVPIEQGRQLLDASPATRKSFVAVPGAHHNDLHFTEPPASTAVGSFFSSAGSAPK